MSGRNARPATPLAKLLRAPAEQQKVTALDAFALAQRTWIAGERLDIGKLADELGVGRATVFRWVGTKEQLYGEVISAAFAQTLDWAVQRATRDVGAERRRRASHGAAFLTSVTHYLLRALVGSRPLRAFIRQDPEYALRIVMSRDSPVEQRVIAAVRALVDAQIAAGHYDAPMEPSALAYVITRIAESFLYRDVITGETPDFETATTAIGLVFGVTPARRRRRGSPEDGASDRLRRDHRTEGVAPLRRRDRRSDKG